MGLSRLTLSGAKRTLCNSTFSVPLGSWEYHVIRQTFRERQRREVLLFSRAHIQRAQLCLSGKTRQIPRYFSAAWLHSGNGRGPARKGFGNRLRQRRTAL